jgi:NADP-dependent 3-hydroxy acid dehydrogenase YdfG
LHRANRLVATAREPRRLEDLLKKYGDQARTPLLDVADEDAAYAAVQAAVDAFGTDFTASGALPALRF